MLGNLAFNLLFIAGMMAAFCYFHGEYKYHEEKEAVLTAIMEGTAEELAVKPWFYPGLERELETHSAQTLAGWADEGKNKNRESMYAPVIVAGILLIFSALDGLLLFAPRLGERGRFMAWYEKVALRKISFARFFLVLLIMVAFAYGTARFLPPLYEGAVSNKTDMAVLEAVQAGAMLDDPDLQREYGMPESRVLYLKAMLSAYGWDYSYALGARLKQAGFLIVASFMFVLLALLAKGAALAFVIVRAGRGRGQ